MRKSIMFAVVVIAVSIFVSGCVAQKSPMSSAPPAFIYNNVAGGIYYQVPMRPIKEKYVVVKKNVVGRASSYNILGVLCSFGDSTYHTAIKNALADYPTADTIIDIYSA